MYNTNNKKNMKQKRLYIITVCLFALSMMSCGNGENQEEYEPKSFERELLFGGYAVDTVFTVNELASAIEKITEDADWLDVALSDAGSDSTKVVYELRIACTRNNTTSVRSTDVVIFCTNKDVLALKVNQGIMDGVDDYHDNVTDQPALAPIR